ncbi:MAG: ECF transporter S component, partial [Acutalibacteraceae bacterium]|nr:ECF transporter S component [Acutalibacteraceae bacterium]
MATTKNKENIYKLTLTAVLTALIFVMAFTPLGFLKIGVVSITFLMIPVVIGAIIGGPAVGAVLGLM